MNYTTKQILLHFLHEYESILEERRELKVSPFLKSFLVRDELIAIVKSSTEKVNWEEHDLENLPIEKLWNIIADDRIIISYYLLQWKKEVKQREALLPDAVQDTLMKLSAQTFYLGFKPLEEWDKYDHSNYWSLLLKAGKVRRLYGIYCSHIAQQKVREVTTPPNRFFDTWEQANKHLQAMKKQGKIKEGEAHILDICHAI